MKIFLTLIAFSTISVVTSSALHDARANESVSSESASSQSASIESASNESTSKANSFLQRMRDASDLWLSHVCKEKICKEKIGDKCSDIYKVKCCPPLKCIMNPPFGRCCTAAGCEADGVEINSSNNDDSTAPGGRQSICPSMKMDLQIVVDGSDSVTENNFNTLNELIAQDLIGALDISPAATVVRHFYCAEQCVLTNSYRGGRRFTGLAMNNAYYYYEGFMRTSPDVSRALIFFTNGETDEADPIKSDKWSKLFTRLGAKVFAVGIGDNISQKGLESIAGTYGRTLRINSYGQEDIKQVLDHIKNVLCHTPIDFQTNFQIRLAGGTDTTGRVEILYGQRWGTICINGGDGCRGCRMRIQSQFSEVVCRQLGRGLGSPETHPSFGQGPGCYKKTKNGGDYRGNAHVTESGRTCQNWVDAGRYYRPSNKIFQNNRYINYFVKNYCRNPSWNHRTNPGLRPWCYASGDPYWEYCDIPACAALEDIVTEEFASKLKDIAAKQFGSELKLFRRRRGGGWGWFGDLLNKVLSGASDVSGELWNKAKDGAKDFAKDVGNQMKGAVKTAFKGAVQNFMAPGGRARASDTILPFSAEKKLESETREDLDEDAPMEVDNYSEREASLIRVFESELKDVVAREFKSELKDLVENREWFGDMWNKVKNGKGLWNIEKNFAKGVANDVENQMKGAVKEAFQNLTRAVSEDDISNALKTLSDAEKELEKKTIKDLDEDGRILLDHIDCLGTETNIGQCRHRGAHGGAGGVHHCPDGMIASVHCSPLTN